MRVKWSLTSPRLDIFVLAGAFVESEFFSDNCYSLLIGTPPRQVSTGFLRLVLYHSVRDLYVLWCSEPHLYSHREVDCLSS